MPYSAVFTFISFSALATKDLMANIKLFNG